MAPQTIGAEYDVVFAGGGTAACIVAGRLANAAPDLKILLLESGPTTKGKMEHIQPGQFLTHLLPTSKTMQFYKSKISEHTGNRSMVVPSGMCVGGGSSVNFMIYNRPAASDLDEWEKDHSNPGWGSKDLIPLLEKAETYEIEPGRYTHGSSGPLKVSYGRVQLPIGKEFIEVGSKLEKDRPVSDEGNALNKESVNVFFPMPKWISKDGRRSDTAHHYLYPAQEANHNVVLADGHRVKRVIFEGTKAVGLEYVLDKRVYPDADQGVHTVRARRMVVLSAGALGSPLILERSGIGAKDVLNRVGIKQVVDLPGVGKEYHDHTFYVSPYVAADDATTYDALYRGEPAEWGKFLAQWTTENGAGMMGSNGCDAAIKIRPREDELAELGPDFTERWKTFYADKPDRPLFWLSAVAGLPADQSALPPLKFLSSTCILGYPASTGYLHITSAEDVYAEPDFDAGFLSSKADVAALRWAYKKAREIIRRMSSFRAALSLAHPQFSEGSKAALTEAGPVPIDAPKIEYSAEDDAAIDVNVRNSVETTWHSLGTCPMKPRDQNGVVDKDLNVYGVTGLKIADLSIAPNNVNCNTYSVAIAIAEKAALIFAQDLGIKGV